MLLQPEKHCSSFKDKQILLQIFLLFILVFCTSEELFSQEKASPPCPHCQRELLQVCLGNEISSLKEVIHSQ